MKKLVVTSLFIVVVSLQNSFAAFISNPIVGASQDKEKFSETQYGLSLELAKEIRLIDNIFFDNNRDFLFNEVGVFANYFNDVIDYNLGARYSFGYGYKDFSLYLSTGYLTTGFAYFADDKYENYNSESGFVGGGVSYKITDYSKIKLDFLGYKLNFTPTNSSNFDKVEAKINSLTLGLQFYF
jgi:hypothetical protein